MHPSALRLLACARISTRNSKKARVIDFRDLTRLLKVSSATMTNWKSRGVSRTGALKAEAETGIRAAFVLDGTGWPFHFSPPDGFEHDPMGVLNRPELWDQMIEQPLSAHPAPHGQQEAHQVSLREWTMDRISPTAWEALMQIRSKDELSPRFVVEMPDDSMAPRVRAGATLFFSRDETPKPGDGILVRDRDGGVYFRVLKQRRPGVWQADAINEAYQALDAERDGLEILAVLTGVEARWS